jgi:hypothetical protein
MMIKTTKLLKKYHTREIPSEQEVIPLDECAYYFHIMPYKTNDEGKAREFLDMLKEKFSSGVIYDQKGSGRYFFKRGMSVLELCITVEENMIYLDSYLCYNQGCISNELFKMIKLDYLVYCILKRYGLQE